MSDNPTPSACTCPWCSYVTYEAQVQPDFTAPARRVRAVGHRPRKRQGVHVTGPFPPMLNEILRARHNWEPHPVGDWCDARDLRSVTFHDYNPIRGLLPPPPGPSLNPTWTPQLRDYTHLDIHVDQTGPEGQFRLATLEHQQNYYLEDGRAVVVSL